MTEYYTAKVFNIQQINEEARKLIFDYYRESHNGSFHHWEVGWVESDDIENYDPEDLANIRSIDQYFKSQGIKDYETVLICIWW